MLSWKFLFRFSILHLIKQNRFLKNFLGTLILITQLQNNSVTPKFVKKVITNLDLLQASGPDFIPLMILKNCEPELSYILAEIFNICLKEPCFSDYWKVSSVDPVVENVRKGLRLKATALLVSFLCFVKSLIGLLVT